jgi:hypothetical protein
MGTGHYNFDEMISLVENQLFVLKKSIFTQQTVIISATTPAAVQKKGT